MRKVEQLPIGHPDWPDYAKCKGREDEMFVEGADQNVAKSLCRHCPVKFHCLAYSLDFQCEKGVWGGMTERERRALLRRHPHITNWRRFFREALQKMNKKEDQHVLGVRSG